MCCCLRACIEDSNVLKGFLSNSRSILVVFSMVWGVIRDVLGSLEGVLRGWGGVLEDLWYQNLFGIHFFVWRCLFGLDFGAKFGPKMAPKSVPKRPKNASYKLHP